VVNYNHGKFFGPSGTYTGYTLICGGLIALLSTSSGISLFLIIPGIFMSFTYSGTIVDIVKRRVKTYISLFGAFNVGKWIDVSQFTGFSIIEVTGRYSLYSRANVKLNMKATDIRLLIINQKENIKIMINKFSNFEDAQKLREELSHLIFPAES
jgi:hypothetical protein